MYIYNMYKKGSDFHIHRCEVKEETIESETIESGIEGYRIILHDERKFGGFIPKKDVETHKELGTTHLIYGYSMTDLAEYAEKNWVA